MASPMMLVLALLGLLATCVCTVHGATTPSNTRTFDVSNTTDSSFSTANLTAATRNEFGSKTRPAAATIISVTTATTAPLRYLRTNRSRLTRATTSTTTSLPPSVVGSSSSVSKEATVASPRKSKNGRRQRYDRPEDTEGFHYVPENPKYYSHSKRMSYSSSTGSSPRFSSSEEFLHLPLDEVLGSESEINSNFDNLQPASKRSSSGESKGGRRDCRMIHKPMPDYLEYTSNGGGGKDTGHGPQKPMMTCYVCGKKDAPFSNGGYTEDCDMSPTNQKDVHLNRDGSYQGGEDYDTPKAKATKSHSKIYNGDETDGQSPYLTGTEKNVESETSDDDHDRGTVNVRDDSDPYYGNDDDSYYGTEEGGGDDGGKSHGGAYPQATDSSGAVYDGNDNYGDTSRGYDDGAETDKSSCKIVYKGKMKCRVCGDPKEGGAFDEQCDYEKDAPEQHHSRAYDYSSNNEKKYRTDPYRGSRGGGRHRGGGGRGHYGDDHGDSYRGYDDNDGYHGSDNYPRYDNYGAGTGFEPDYGNTGPSYDYGNGDDYQKRNGQSKEQPEASTTISDKKDVGSGESNDPKKRNCKVTYKDVSSSYSDYDTKKKKKPKMKCLVCNGNGGVTEECSYNGAGELTASFPGPSDLSSFFGRDTGDHSFYNPTDFDGIHDLFF